MSDPRSANGARMKTPEHNRLEEARTGAVAWKAWGPYLSERQWGTVREDYSGGGDAWDYFPHDQARSRAYRWGEDGIAGICDDRQRLCLALALWNGADPILKERMFGLTNSEGNHGEDVKEYWFYLDSTPTHSYLKCQYKYPQRAFPYLDLVSTNGRRSKQEMEYELLDTGIFDDDRYFDVVVEYAKAGPDDILMLVTAHNRGPDAATLHLLPTLWFRNTWSWGDEVTKPSLTADEQRGIAAVRASHPELGEWVLSADASAQLLFCENETNNERLFGVANPSPYVKDGINEFVVNGRAAAVNQERTGTKVAADHVLEVPAGESASIRLRLTASGGPQTEVPGKGKPLGADFDRTFKARRKEADDFYAKVIPGDAARGRGDGDASGAGGVVVGQAVLRVQRAPVVARAWRRSVGLKCPFQRGAQCAVVSHGRGRCDLDAGQVGVSVVRGVGSGVSLCAAVAGRRRLRQGAGRAVARHPVSAPERPGPGVRVELQ